jgi:hypothetical protein
MLTYRPLTSAENLPVKCPEPYARDERTKDIEDTNLSSL